MQIRSIGNRPQANDTSFGKIKNIKWSGVFDPKNNVEHCKALRRIIDSEALTKFAEKYDFDMLIKLKSDSGNVPLLGGQYEASLSFHNVSETGDWVVVEKINDIARRYGKPLEIRNGKLVWCDGDLQSDATNKLVDSVKELKFQNLVDRFNERKFRINDQAGIKTFFNALADKGINAFKVSE